MITYYLKKAKLIDCTACLIVFVLFSSVPVSHFRDYFFPQVYSFYFFPQNKQILDELFLFLPKFFFGGIGATKIADYYQTIVRRSRFKIYAVNEEGKSSLHTWREGTDHDWRMQMLQ